MDFHYSAIFFYYVVNVYNPCYKALPWLFEINQMVGKYIIRFSLIYFFTTDQQILKILSVKKGDRNIAKKLYFCTQKLFPQ